MFSSVRRGRQTPKSAQEKQAKKSGQAKAEAHSASKRFVYFYILTESWYFCSQFSWTLSAMDPASKRLLVCALRLNFNLLTTCSALPEEERGKRRQIREHKWKSQMKENKQRVVLPLKGWFRWRFALGLHEQRSFLFVQCDAHDCLLIDLFYIFSNPKKEKQKRKSDGKKEAKNTDESIPVKADSSSKRLVYVHSSS